MSQMNQKVSMSYVTGAHAFKVGLFTLQGVQQINERYLMQDLHLFLPQRGPAPISLRQYAWPASFKQNVQAEHGTLRAGPVDGRPTADTLRSG